MSAVHESTTTVEVLLSKAALNASLEPVSVGFKTERRWEKEKKEHLCALDFLWKSKNE